MSDNKVPSLSTDGWIETPYEKADILMSDFLIAEHSQTILYPNKIASLPFIVQNNINDNIGLNNEIKNKLGNLLQRYFESVTIESTTEDDPSDGTKTILNIYAKMTTASGEEINLARTLQIKDAKIVEIIKQML